MKKALVVTINDFGIENYGNALQNAASLLLLRQIGLKADTFSLKSVRHRDLQLYYKSLFHKITFGAFSRNKIFWKTVAKRKKAFFKFKRMYLSNVFYNEPMYDSAYDFYCVGSDQVWNPTWYSAATKRKELFLLPFVPKEKRVCMAPSFGIADIPDEWKEYFSQELRNFPHLSVREEAGAKIIKELTGRDAEVVIDPTLALTAEQWKSFEKKPKDFDHAKPYILTYFLGNRTERVQQDVTQIAAENGYEVYHLLDLSQPNVYVAGPSEFLYLISHAVLVMTDSFHACVFSFLYNKPFLVYDRNWKEGNMNSRIETFLSKFHLERKYAGSGIENDIWEHNYEKGYRILEYERANAITFLKEALTK